jgi:hypothetical protein
MAFVTSSLQHCTQLHPINGCYGEAKQTGTYHYTSSIHASAACLRLGIGDLILLRHVKARMIRSVCNGNIELRNLRFNQIIASEGYLQADQYTIGLITKLEACVAILHASLVRLSALAAVTLSLSWGILAQDASAKTGTVSLPHLALNQLLYIYSSIPAFRCSPVGESSQACQSFTYLHCDGITQACITRVR